MDIKDLVKIVSANDHVKLAFKVQGVLKQLHSQVLHIKPLMMVIDSFEDDVLCDGIHVIVSIEDKESGFSARVRNSQHIDSPSGLGQKTIVYLDPMVVIPDSAKAIAILDDGELGLEERIATLTQFTRRAKDDL